MAASRARQASPPRPMAPEGQHRGQHRGGAHERRTVHDDARDAGHVRRSDGAPRGGHAPQFPPDEALERDGHEPEGARGRAHPSGGDLPQEQVAALAVRLQAHLPHAAAVRAESRDQPAVHLRPDAQGIVHRVHDPAGLRLLPRRLGRVRAGGQWPHGGGRGDEDPAAARPEGARVVRGVGDVGARLLHGRAAVGVLPDDASGVSPQELHRHGGPHRLLPGGDVRPVARRALLRRRQVRGHARHHPRRHGQARLQAPQADDGPQHQREPLVESVESGVRRGLQRPQQVGERVPAVSRRVLPPVGEGVLPAEQARQGRARDGRPAGQALGHHAARCSPWARRKTISRRPPA